MKKAISIFLILMMLYVYLPVLGETSVYAQEKPTRVINVVYDDSGSMIREKGVYFDTWCQAKYAMEVFAAMLDEKDTLNVFVMSDYYKTDGSKKARLSLSGSEDSADRVRKIHDMLTTAGGTPFAAVEKAYSELKSMVADDKWLVVLTDGAFNKPYSDVASVDAKLNEYVADGTIKVMFLAIGSEPASISEKKDQIFFKKAVNNNEILPRITAICNKIFKRNTLSLDKASKSFEFDVPLDELLVFAQGQDVSIKSIRPPDGTSVDPVSSVNVKYSEVADIAFSNDPNVKVATNLKGVVATFTGDFRPGKYFLDVTGADTIEIYYKPNVHIGAKLYNLEDEEINKDKIVSGDYVLKFGFIGADNDFIEESALLGKVDYSATVNNTDINGNLISENSGLYKSGDIIHVERGSLSIEVKAGFLEYMKAEDTIDFKVQQAGEKLDLLFGENPTYELTTNGLVNGDRPIVLTVKQKGELLSKEKWELMDIPEVSSEKNITLRCERGQDVSTFLIYPVFHGNPFEAPVGEIDFTVEASFVHDEQLSESGPIKEKLTIENKISTLDRFKDWLKRNWLWILILIVLLTLVILFWKRKLLPKSFGKSATFTLDGEDIVGSKFNLIGKKGWHQTGTVELTSSGTPEIRLKTSFNVKAVDNWRVPAKRRKMVVTDISPNGNTSSVSVPGGTFEKSEDGKWVSGLEKTMVQSNIKFGPGTRIVIDGRNTQELTVIN